MSMEQDGKSGALLVKAQTGGTTLGDCSLNMKLRLLFRTEQFNYQENPNGNVHTWIRMFPAVPFRIAPQKNSTNPHQKSNGGCMGGSMG